MAGRFQGDSRPSQHPHVRLTVVAAAVALAALLGSAVTSGRDVRAHVADAVASGSKLTPDERQHAAGNQLGFDAAPFDAFRATLRKSDRYSVDVPARAKGPFITSGAVVRAYAAFYFLPGIQEPQAGRVFHYRFR